MKITTLGIDLAKNVFQLHGVNDLGKIVLRKKLDREKLLPFIANIPPCLIGMEACGSAHYWAREFRKLGHDVKLMAPQFVKPFVKSNKNDANDAEAICEAVARPNMRFVAIKEVSQQDLQCIHRIRSRTVKARTALANEIRGLLLEYGIAIPKSISKLRSGLPGVFTAHADKLTSLGSELFTKLLEEFRNLDAQVDQWDQKIQAIFKAHPECLKLTQIPGIGPMTAAALISSIADPSQFKNGRQLAAWIGLVPKQHSSGGKNRLLGISKKGDVYLRTLLVHGARSVIQYIDKKTDSQSLWLKKLIERRGKNKAAVALANKNARVIWVLLTKNVDYKMAA